VYILNTYKKDVSKCSDTLNTYKGNVLKCFYLLNTYKEVTRAKWTEYPSQANVI